MMMAQKEIKIPNIGGYTDVPVIDIYVAEGDTVAEEDSLIALESSKAVMDIPSPHAGTVKEIRINENDTVSEGDVFMVMELESDAEAAEETDAPAEESAGTGIPEKTAGQSSESSTESTVESSSESSSESSVESTGKADQHAESLRKPGDDYPDNQQEPGAVYHASPSVRQFARETGVDLSQAEASGPHGRILREDIVTVIHSVMQQAGSSGGAAAGPAPGAAAAGTGGSGFTLPPQPDIDFSRFGAVEEEKLTRIQQISGPHLHKSWLGIPHVTHFDEADVTELEQFRRMLKQEIAADGPKISILPFIIKAAVSALKQYPRFNSSLAPSGESVILKQYWNIGVAVDTPEGLMVPVVKSADGKSVSELAADLERLSEKARNRKLAAEDIEGASFSISSLGGIGGTGFTPLINSPEAAILGVSRMQKKPVWNGTEFIPRDVLPFSVTYDHRIIDGAYGARFARYLGELLSDIRRVLV